MKPECHSVEIGDRRIGDDGEVYIIAEAGVNHDGDAAKARQLMDAARCAGADAVKFQVFCADRLVSAGAPTCEYQSHGTACEQSQREMLRRLELAEDVFIDLKHYADECGLDFLATPFGLPELEFLARTLKINAIKLASSDLVNVPLLSAAADLGLPLIVSTGAANMLEVKRAVTLIRDRQQAKRLILLHCVSSYPTKLESVRLRRMKLLSEEFDGPIGFSDHSMEIETGAYAVLAGARVLEKHITLSRDERGPDHFFSLEPHQFEQYVSQARLAERALGDAGVSYAEEEEEIRRLARGRLVACRSIPRGAEIDGEALVVQRPGDGISPSEWKDVIGRVAIVEIAADTPLEWSMLD